MVTQPFTGSVRQFPTATRDPLLISREQAEKLVQEQDVQTKLLREILVELRAQTEMTAPVLDVKADHYRAE